MPRLTKHQKQADEISAQIEAFLASGKTITTVPDDATGDSYLIRCDKGLKNAQTKTAKELEPKFNGAL